MKVHGCIVYDTSMDFGAELRAARRRARSTQADIAAATGIARPNIAAYEAGRREPRLSTAIDLLGAVGAHIAITPAIDWSWTTDRRPFAVPNQLWRLPISRALATITTSQHLWWSGPDRTFDLSDQRQRRRAYEIVLREGTPHDIEATIDGVLLVQEWHELVLPAELRRAWTPAIEAATTTHDATAA